MLTPRCPKCGSHKIRRGYRRMRLILRLFGIHSLLCDHCNWLFTGFAFPGVLPREARRRSNR